MNDRYSIRFEILSVNVISTNNNSLKFLSKISDIKNLDFTIITMGGCQSSCASKIDSSFHDGAKTCRKSQAKGFTVGIKVDGGPLLKV